jgi:hypothetical protein
MPTQDTDGGVIARGVTTGTDAQFRYIARDIPDEVISLVGGRSIIGKTVLGIQPCMGLCVLFCGVIRSG